MTKITSAELRKLLYNYAHVHNSFPTEAKKKIVAGKKRGLAYHLFAGFKIPKIPAVRSLKEMDRISLYFVALKEYVGEAEQYALDHRFDLVYVGKRDKVISGFDFQDDNLYRAGIGKVNADSITDCSRFLGMINRSYAHLERRYQKVCGLAKNF